MFKKLMDLAQQGDFTMAVRASPSDKALLTVIVAPLPKVGQDPALSQPIRLTGTIDELEANFANTIDRFIGARSSLTEQVDATLAIIEEAKKASAKKATDALKGKSKGAASAASAPTPVETGFDEDLDDDDGPSAGAGDGDELESVAAVPVAAGASAVSDTNLFG